MSLSSDKVVFQRFAFYSLYKKFCLRKNFVPLIIIKPKNNQFLILDFFADRIKYDDWIPIIHALKQDRSLHIIAIRMRRHRKHILENIDTEAKCRKLKKIPVLLTDYVCLAMLEAVAECLFKSKALYCLILEGIPLSPTYLNLIIDSLSKNPTICHLSLKYCFIGDEGCRMICQILKELLNIQTLDLTGCNISKIGAGCIADTLKCQGIVRYGQHWTESLRYRQCDLNSAGGLRRITLNENRIKDDGAKLILERLHEDLWLKALDLQNCHITDNGAEYVLETLQINSTIDVIDIRCNKKVNRSLLKEVLAALDRPSYGNVKKYEWLGTPMEVLIYKRRNESFSGCEKNLPEVENLSKKELQNVDMPKRKQWRPELRKKREENWKQIRLHTQNNLFQEFSEECVAMENMENSIKDLHSRILLIEKESQKHQSMFVDTSTETIKGIFDVFRNFVQLIDNKDTYERPTDKPGNRIISSCFKNIQHKNLNSPATKFTSSSTFDGLSRKVNKSSSNASLDSASLTDTTVVGTLQKELSKEELSHSFVNVHSDCSDTSSSRITTIVESPSCSSMTSYITLKDEVTMLDDPESQSQNLSNIPEMLMGLLKKVNSVHAGEKASMDNREVKSESMLLSKLKCQHQNKSREVTNVFEKDMGDVSSSEENGRFSSKRFQYGIFHA